MCTNQECVLTRSILYVTFVEDSDDGSPKGSPSPRGQLMKAKEREDDVDVDKEEDEDKGDTGPLLSLTSRDSLSHEVFSNLPEDLQEILRSSSFICKCDLCVYSHVCTCTYRYTIQYLLSKGVCLWCMMI